MGIRVGLLECIGAVGAIAAYDEVLKQTNLTDNEIEVYTMEGDRILLTFKGTKGDPDDAEDAVKVSDNVISNIPGSEVLSQSVLRNIDNGAWNDIEATLQSYAQRGVLSVSKDELLDFKTVGSNKTKDVEVNFIGAKVNDAVALGPQPDLKDGLVLSAFVSDADKVKVRAGNVTGSPIQAVTGVYRITLLRTLVFT